MTVAAPSFAELAASLPEHIAEFLGTSLDDVRARMAVARDERNRRWIEADPRFEAERNALYTSLGELDLLKYAQWHAADRAKQRLHDEIVAFARERHLRVLDCGGGIGDTTLAFATHGVDVTYVDFPGPCSEFAAFRFEKLGCVERIAQLSPEVFWKATATFDAVASIDVLEHLDNPVRHARRYHELLTAGGHLFVTAHFRHSRRNPDHLVENDGYHRVFGGEPRTRRRCVLTNLGFRRRRWYWYEKRG